MLSKRINYLKASHKTNSPLFINENQGQKSVKTYRHKLLQKTRHLSQHIKKIKFVSKSF